MAVPEVPLSGEVSDPPGKPMPIATARALLAASSDALLHLDAAGRIAWSNGRLEAACGQPPGALQGRDVRQLLGLPPQAALAAAEHRWTTPSGTQRWLSLQTPGPQLLLVQDITDVRALGDEARRLAELLDMAQEFGRLGVWERDIPSGEGRWDRHMFRFFGLDPAGGTPNFALTAQHIHPDDRVDPRLFESMTEPGQYTRRYRIVMPDGRIRRVHSQWEVKSAPGGGTPTRAIGIMVDDTEAYELAESFNDTSAQLKIAVDLGNIAIWRHDLKRNRMYYNERAYQVLDITPRPEGMAMEEVRALIHPDDLPQVLATSQAALRSDRPVDMEARYRRPDGSFRYVLTRRVVRRDAEGTPIEFVGVALDVTEQVEHTRRATELAKRLEIAATAAGLGIWSRDPQTRRAEWNDEMFRIIGRPKEAGVPSGAEWMTEVVHPDDRAFMERVRDEIRASDEVSVEHEYRIRRPDGEVRWLVNRVRRESRDGRPMLFGITIDVTERVKTEAALRSANERIGLAVRSVGIGTWEWLPRTDTSVWDEAMFRLRGLEPSERVPNEAERAALVWPEDRERVAAALEESVRTRSSAAYEFRVVWPDGSVHWLASRSTAVTDASGQVHRHMGVNWDITEARSAEIARQERAVAQRESSAKSEFLARMSHELRTPLNAVLGFAQLLQFDARALSADHNHKVEHIAAAGRHLLSLINDVLDLSSLESGNLRLDLQPLALHEVVYETLPLVEALAREHGVTLHADRLQATVRADRIRLRQVLINLLTNGIKYNRPHGRVTLTCTVDATHVTLHVTDTGRGLRADQLPQLFEPFNRLGIENEGIDGTGIGLAVVKALVERMEGAVMASSQPGTGSQFDVRLPRADAPAAPLPAGARPVATTPARVAEPAPGERRGQVLYIEDNPVNVLLVEELVRGQAGLSIESAASGEAGVERARELQPDLVLIDMQLPDFDGFEVLRRLRAQPETAHIRCVALSANAMPEDIARARHAGFDDYWTKPIDFTEFLGGLDRLFPPSPAP
jgi:PAS domain S-box-containing protein